MTKCIRIEDAIFSNNSCNASLFTLEGVKRCWRYYEDEVDRLLMSGFVFVVIILPICTVVIKINLKIDECPLLKIDFYKLNILPLQVTTYNRI